jgi:membrane associated rhomboid family serine protease
VAAPVGVLCVDCVRAAEKTAGGARARAAARSGRGTVTIALIGMNVAFYLYGMLTGMTAWQTTFGLAPALGVTEPWRWVTSAFVHVGLLHIGLNMLMLYQFGRQLEMVLGTARFVVLYVVSMVGGSLAVVVLAHGFGVHVGASGAIFGLFAAYGVLLYSRKLPWQSLAATAGIWLVAGFIIPGISWQGHVGGAIAGAATMAVYLALDKAKRRA